jgi:hypothetical protein
MPYPLLGNYDLGQVSFPVFRQWRAERLAAGVGPVTIAKTYRLLRAIFNTAVDDELVRRNACRIPGAGSEPIPERPTATLAQVFALADAAKRLAPEPAVGRAAMDVSRRLVACLRQV